jgi:hypothetical protein
MADSRKSCLRDTQMWMDRLDCMEAFVASVHHGSLSRAAHALGRSITAHRGPSARSKSEWARHF